MDAKEQSAKSSPGEVVVELPMETDQRLGTRPIPCFNPQGAWIKPSSLQVEAAEYAHSYAAGTCTLAHPLLETVRLAYSEHHNLLLTPDIIWLAIVQGFAQHVGQNAADLRSLFVQTPSGKVKISVRHDGLRRRGDGLRRRGDGAGATAKMSATDWAKVFPVFEEGIAKEMGDELTKTVVANFSTTTPTTRIVSQIALMDVVQSYVEFEVMTFCGIPRIILQGTAQDWASIRDRTRALGKKYKLQWWTDLLDPILQQFHSAVDTNTTTSSSSGGDGKQEVPFWQTSGGEPFTHVGGWHIDGDTSPFVPFSQIGSGKTDVAFWQSIFKHMSGSGGDTLTGWLMVFFPYLHDKHANKTYRNEYMEQWRRPRRVHGIPLSHMSTAGQSSVPFIWKYYEETLPMQFQAGFTGTTVVDHGKDGHALTVHLGWAVVHEKPVAPPATQTPIDMAALFKAAGMTDARSAVDMDTYTDEQKQQLEISQFYQALKGIQLNAMRDFLQTHTNTTSFKPPATTLTTDSATWSFGSRPDGVPPGGLDFSLKPSTETPPPATPTFSFGSSSSTAPTPATPTFSFGQTTTTETNKSTKKFIIELKYPLVATEAQVREDMKARGVTLRRVFVNDTLRKVTVSVEGDVETMANIHTLDGVLSVREMGTIVPLSFGDSNTPAQPTDRAFYFGTSTPSPTPRY